MSPKKKTIPLYSLHPFPNCCAHSLKIKEERFLMVPRFYVRPLNLMARDKSSIMMSGQVIKTGLQGNGISWPDWSLKDQFLCQGQSSGALCFGAALWVKGLLWNTPTHCGFYGLFLGVIADGHDGDLCLRGDSLAGGWFWG